MAELPREIAIGFDMYGCPNQCRHCSLGPLPHGRLTEATVRDTATLFRRFIRSGEQTPYFHKVWVSTSIREPDFSDDYRRLFDLEVELSGARPRRFELMSVWRLAADDKYVDWVKRVGPDTCQITFFGGPQTTDWFYRRKGAFEDGIGATERLLAAGMKPRWQVFANTKGIPELPGLLERIDTMRLRERAAAIGGAFEVFLHLWDPLGSALEIEHLRPTMADVEKIPSELLEASKRYHGRDVLWRSEAELCREIMAREPYHDYGLEPGHMGWFLISADQGVYFNAYGLEASWCLGNLANEPLAAILQRFEKDDIPGLRAVHRISAQDLVREYGDWGGQKAYSSANDLLRLYLARYLEDHA